MKSYAAILFLGTILASGAVHAQPSPSDPCQASGGTYAQSECLDKLLKTADSALNATYRKAQTSIDKNDLMDADQRRSWKQALQKAQRAWVAFRDADCGEPVGYEWFQGTGMGPATLVCHLEKTKIRNQELTDRYVNR
ncbi:lysozyme inhibitor LprI family protein [Microvirga sp. 2TAF3]|uniref:lysozyme inhibitor LprI family protein n=1 Tax=Microvirga sp. 2TAF3 TaxID=3233014 RepID=UPI003F96F9D5